ncbi:RNaseH domain-containing protein [Streptomyces sp. NPDC038707]|uniref:RNaseH domain-containing protein n=1 Tax=Streptomyces sp. NPDC038707 TaxID=3154329 RepID=UPI0033C7D8E0
MGCRSPLAGQRVVPSGTAGCDWTGRSATGGQAREAPGGCGRSWSRTRPPGASSFHRSVRHAASTVRLEKAQRWPGLRNGALDRDMLGFGAEPAQRHTLYGHDLRVLLVRDANARGEVAEWYAHDTEDGVGFAEGVWGTADSEGRVFASTASKPHTVAKLPKGLMKLVPTAQGRTVPGKTAWNPGQLEITVLGCLSEKALTDSGRAGDPPDRPAEWATLAHQLRYHDDYPPLARPLPLHLARLAGEYVLPVAGTKQAGSTSSAS